MQQVWNLGRSADMAHCEAADSGEAQLPAGICTALQCSSDRTAELVSVMQTFVEAQHRDAGRQPSSGYTLL